MVAGAGSGGVDRIGGRGSEHLVGLAGERGRATDPLVRQAVAAAVAEERIRSFTNERVRAASAGPAGPGPAASIGKVHQGALNQRIQLLATDLLGTAATAWDAEAPAEVRGMLRSRANTIEGGTTEVNKNVLGERVLGLPREPDPWQGALWSEIPRS